MKDPRNHLPRDLQALRYLDALHAGDLAAVAALWDEASRDSELERALAELDGALFLEDAGANQNTGAERARSLLPEHLRNGVPGPQSPTAPLRWAGRVGVVGTVAAVCLLAVLAWRGRDGKKPYPSPGPSSSERPVAHLPPDDSDRSAAWPRRQRIPDEADMPMFTWPLETASALGVSKSIPPDLLD
jgi:hypothetical protein